MIHLLLPKISMYLFGKVALAGIVIIIVVRTSGIEIYNSAGIKGKSRRLYRNIYIK